MIEEIFRIVSSLGFTKSKIEVCLSQFSKSEVASLYTLLTEECLLPSGLDLLPHQREIMLTLLKGQRGVIAAFPMGSGKTITAIAASECLRSQARMLGVKVNLCIIVPTSLIGNYKEELKKSGYTLQKGDMIITKTKFYRKVKNGEITSLKNYVVIYDEAHTLRTDYRCEFCSDLVLAIKGPQEDTMAEVSLKIIASAWKVIGLTGTPVYNQPYDWINLWALATGQPPLTSYEYFGLKDTQLGTQEGYTSENRVDYLQKYPRADPEILRNIFAFYDLPRDDFPKRKDVYHLINMTPEYQNAYERLEYKYSSERRRKRKSTSLGGDFDDEGRNAFMVRLRVAMNKARNANGTIIISPKVKESINIILKAKRGVILFSEFLSQGLDVIKAELSLRGIRWGEINGSVSASKRDTIVKNYNAKKIKVIIITKAGGEGLNLLETSDIILLESGWTSSQEEQVIARGIRKGSHTSVEKEEDRVVTVHHLILIKKGTEERVVNYLNLVPDSSLRVGKVAGRFENFYKTAKTPLSGVRWIPTKMKEEVLVDRQDVANMGADVYLKWFSNNKDVANQRELSFLRDYGLHIH